MKYGRWIASKTLDRFWYVHEDDEDDVYGEVVVMEDSRGNRSTSAHFRADHTREGLSKSRLCDGLDQCFQQVTLWGYKFCSLYPAKENSL